MNWLVPLILVLTQILYPTGRAKPVRYNLVKRSVSVNLVAIDKTIGPIQWWHLEAPRGKPNHEHVSGVIER